MVTRVFWIAVSLLESDYEHEFLMAIHLLNKVSVSLHCVAKPKLTLLPCYRMLASIYGNRFVTKVKAPLLYCQQQ